jgi:ABC-type nitrate/sulfonate/bicarbonate transport system ATPase subunit
VNMLECSSIDFSYPLQNGSSLSILKNFNLTLAHGEILSLLGPSGCGKTTALNLLSGFLTADAGRVEYQGDELQNPFPGGQMIFQDSNQLLPWLTAEENILFPISRRPFPGMKIRVDTKQRQKLDNILSMVGLNDFRDYHPVRLSGGMKQRCALARALMADAEILFMDEPFGALDAPSRRELQNLLLDLWKEKGFSVVFVTHDISEAINLSDRIILFSSPASTVREIQVGLNRPRERRESSFKEMEIDIYSSLTDTEEFL